MGRYLSYAGLAAIVTAAAGGLAADVAYGFSAESTARQSDYVEVAANSTEVPQPKGLEVVLVLDVTGSMYSNSSQGERRIVAMRDAALTPVDTLFDDNPAPDLLKVSIVPYNTAVNIGTDMHQFVLDTGLDVNGDPTTPNPFNETTWFGCVQARKGDYDLADVYLPGATFGSSITQGDSISTIMANCTTDPVNHYFHAPSMVDLETAFGEIFDMLTSMRLAN